MDVKFVMFKDTGDRKEFILEPGKTLIGRKEDCDLRIPLSEISRKHAVIIVDEKTVTLRDLGSSNGTYVNNKRMAEQELGAGDHVVVGPVVFTVQINGEPADVRPVHTRLEARTTVGGAQVASSGSQPAASSDADAEDIFSDDDDPISALEALAASDDTAALDVNEDSYLDSDDSQL